MAALYIPKPVYKALRAHGEYTYPHECCGALLGTSGHEGWHVTSAIRAGNTRTDSAHNRYSIDPAELVRIQRDAMRQGLDIAGFYHSHPDHPAEWSPTDFDEAHWVGCVYVITAVARGSAAVTNAFLLAGTSEEDKQFEQIPIEVLDKTPGGAPS